MQPLQRKEEKKATSTVALVEAAGEVCKLRCIRLKVVCNVSLSALATAVGELRVQASEYLPKTFIFVFLFPLYMYRDR